MAETITALVCDWGLHLELAEKLCRALHQAEEETGLSWSIISGYRSPEEQEELIRQGRPAAPVELSTHTTWPATGADVSVSTPAISTLKATWGRIATMNGMRWGGGSPPDDAGIPSDWNHVDLGPRKDRDAVAYREGRD